MKLYYKKGACALSPQIALREAGLDFDMVAVDTTAKKTADGRDYLGINPKGSVPALELDDGQVLTEGAAIVQYVADLAPAKNLAPAAGSMERYRLQEMLNFISTEVHKGYSPLFGDAADSYKASVKDRLAAKYALLDKTLTGRDYLMGSTFTVADGYLYNVTRWAAYVGLDLSGYSHIRDFMQRVEGRPAVQAALQAEGLQ